MRRRLPAEWEAQDGILLAWPHAGTDWAPQLPEVEAVFGRIAREVTRFERLLVVAADGLDVARKLRVAGARMDAVSLHEIPFNDTWARDFGPLTVVDDGLPLLLDFGFNGWGLKFPADQDNRITRRLSQAGAFASDVKTVGLVLEGGSLESDGVGTLLTTAECLLGPNRNPHLSRADLEAALGAELGADRVLWLENGYLAGDDTDAHVDTLARFCPGDTILHVSCEDPADEHFDPIGRMVGDLRSLRTREGRPYSLVALPWPSPRYDRDGRRLPATYANFLVINGAVLVPTYRDPKDALALETLSTVFAGREIVGIDCVPLILQHGSLHCVTMQLPKGVLR